MNNYQLIALDVDGTLVEGESGRLSDRVIRAIKGISDRVHVILCTGRDAAESAPILEALDLTEQYRILGGGSCIVAPDGTVEITAGLTTDLVAEAVGLVGAEPITSYQLTPSGWERFRPGQTPQMLSFHSRDASHAGKIVELLSPLHAKLFITQVTDTEHPERVNVHLGTLGVSKGTALKKLSTRLGVASHQIISVGDMPIDIPMFEVSGLAVAMGNAPQSVKDRAHFVAPSLAEDGVAVVIEKFLLG